MCQGVDVQHVTCLTGIKCGRMDAAYDFITASNFITKILLAEFWGNLQDSVF